MSNPTFPSVPPSAPQARLAGGARSKGAATVAVALLVGCGTGTAERESDPGESLAPAPSAAALPTPRPAGAAAPTFGFLPTTVSVADATAAYEQWKTGYLEDCGAGVYRVKYQEPENTVSEGIAYGMLLAAYHGEQEVLDGLWQYYKNNRDSRGMMHWRRAGCEGGPTDGGDNAASDADIDAAMALIKASCQWSNAGAHDYAADATTLLLAIQRAELAKSGTGYYLKPGDSFGGATCINYSYFAPGYYRIFADYVSERADVWDSMPSVTYDLLDVAQNPTTGLVPNWAETDGSTPPSGCTWYTNPERYGWDAVRTPWRIAMDYLWWGEPRAEAYLRKLSAWVQSFGGLEAVRAEHALDGASLVSYSSVPATGGLAFSGVAVDQATSDAYFEILRNSDTPGYYHESLRALYLLAGSGMMRHDCSAVVYP